MTKLERVRDVAGAERWLALASTCVAVDHPGRIAGSLEEVLLQVSGDQRASRYAHFVAVEDGVDVAYATARMPMRDNLSNATVSFAVLPSHRRRGIGTLLANEIFAFVRREGRTNAVWTVGSPLGEESPGCTFSRVLGAKNALSRLRRDLDLANVSNEVLDHLRTGINGQSNDYEIVTWIDRAPDEFVTDVARLVGRMSTDTPRGELSWESEVWDASRWREKEDDAFRSGRRRLAAGAVDESGRLVAFTDIGVYVHRPEVAEQWNTVVDPDHRGHRLGLAVKVENLRNLRRNAHGSLRLETWNAIENSRMIAINELLGFHVVERVDEFQMSLLPNE